ncbi:hypothetical protein PY254_03135 [Rhodanobacter sp. AS-Z3]|uniref:hypothetical protein n=1 Tax=Rhodanobacter sp. AS-Z3 TaxID=3031330 RepID=UPI00247B01C4|nr:hypothetical protein [Rhodanobacter sp. AS-Z3]WEN15684.1 hypothetical protein PY254_03135 [Rhodanobacter sp. AS-Z3]
MNNGKSLSGHIVHAVLGAEWFPRQNVGVGAEYFFSRSVLHPQKQACSGDLDIKLDGPSLLVRLRFRACPTPDASGTGAGQDGCR